MKVTKEEKEEVLEEICESSHNYIYLREKNTIMYKCKITVMKKCFHADLIAKYENPIEHACDLSVGQVFISENGEKPKDLCPSAWLSLQPYTMALAYGAEDFFDGWMKDPKSAMISCNDGFRPVSFLIERL